MRTDLSGIEEVKPIGRELPGAAAEREENTGRHLGFCLGVDGPVASLTKALDRRGGMEGSPRCEATWEM